MTDSRWNRFVTKPYLMPNPSVMLSHGPLAHVQERQNYYISMCIGGSLAFFDQVSLNLFYLSTTASSRERLFIRI